MTTRHTEIYSGKAKRRVIYGVQYLFLIVVSIVCVFPFLWMLIGATNKSMDITLGKMSLGNQFFNNLKNLQRLMGETFLSKVNFLMDFSDNPRQIKDPWYTGDFDAAYSDIWEGCVSFFDYLKRKGEL